MPIRIKVETKGLEALARRIAQWSPKLKKEMQLTSERIAAAVQPMAAAEAPIDTGYMAGHIRIQPLRTVGTMVYLAAEDFPPDAFYPVVVHSGSEETEPQPFLAQAAKDYKRAARKDWGVGFRRFRRRIRR